MPSLASDSPATWSHVSDRPSTRLRADGVGAHDHRRREGTHSVVDRPWHKITEDERRGRRSAKEGAERRRVGDATLTSPQRSGAAAKSVGKSLTSPQRRGTEEQHGGASGGGGGGGAIRTEQKSTVQSGTGKHGVVSAYPTISYCTVKYSTVQYRTVLYPAMSAIRCQPHATTCATKRRRRPMAARRPATYIPDEYASYSAVKTRAKEKGWGDRSAVTWLRRAQHWLALIPPPPPPALGCTAPYRTAFAQSRSERQVHLSTVLYCTVRSRTVCTALHR